MEQTLVVVAAVLAAVLVGAAVPALLQLRRTLRTLETFLETTGVRLNQALDEASEAAAKVQLVAGRIEDEVAELHKLLATAGSVAESLGELRDALRGVLGSVAAVGPAIAGTIYTVASRVTAARERPVGAGSQ